jgi:asparagine synthase (glutamine-hydrolysing)
MCSIAGYISGNKSEVKRMLDSMVHRAPDDIGMFQDSNLSMGMGRLKIIDLKSENLCPMETDEFVLCYNGEIYNFLELRNTLKKKYNFKTLSDTEVLLYSWKEWGTKVFDKLNGMFAFAIYDKKKQKIYLARDIPGEKPLYYYNDEKKFIFASEAKALTKVVSLKKNKNNIFYKNFQHFLNNTMFKNVFQLPAAHYLEYDLIKKKFHIQEYWKFKKKKINVKTADEELEYLLKNSIKLRLRSDVPTGIYLSEGLDSNLIASFHKFKSKFYFDDSKNWKNDFYKKINKIVHHLDFPVGSLSSYPLWKLAEKAKKNDIKVILSGEGADEIFSGYVRYLPISLQWELENKYKSYKPLFKKFYNSYLDSFSRITARSEDHDYVKIKIKEYFEMFDDPINAMGFSDFKLIMPSLLQMGDRMSAAFGIENRCPYLDKNIIEFGYSLPPELKINGLRQKIMLRNLAEKRKVLKPLHFEKKGLTIRFNTWFKRTDWDRSYYFILLNKIWNLLYKHS